MKKTAAILLLILLSGFVRAQQLKAGIFWPAIQFTKVSLNHNVSLDTGKLYFRIDKVSPVTRVQTNLPGPYVQYENKKSLFLRAGLFVGRNEFRMGPHEMKEAGDSLYLYDDWKVYQPTLTTEAGYFFGHQKPFKPFVSGGLNLSVFTVGKIRSDEDYDVQVYKDYFTGNPLSLSAQARLGFQLRTITLSASFKTSLTALDKNKAINRISCFSLLEFGWHFYRSPYLGKKQYEENTGINRIDYTDQLDLKRRGHITGLRVPLYNFVMAGPYVDAWQNIGYNYLVQVREKPRLNFTGEVFGCHTKTLNAKKTWYYKHEYGFNMLIIQYKNALRRTYGLPYFYTPDVAEERDLEQITEDVKYRFTNFFYSIKTGYRIKTGKKSFIYADLGLRYQLCLKSYKKDTEIPYFRKNLLWINSEIGMQLGHKGIQLGVSRTIVSPDAFGIYKNINVAYIGIYHEIYSR